MKGLQESVFGKWGMGQWNYTCQGMALVISHEDLRRSLWLGLPTNMAYPPSLSYLLWPWIQSLILLPEWIPSVTPHGLWQGSANMFCKEPRGKYLGFTGHMAHGATIQIYCGEKAATGYSGCGPCPSETHWQKQAGGQIWHHCLCNSGMMEMFRYAVQFGSHEPYCWALEMWYD